MVAIRSRRSRGRPSSPTSTRSVPMTPVEIRARVRDILLEILELEPDELPDAAAFSEQLGADSLKRLELTLRLEKAFNTAYALQDLSRMSSVDAAVRITEQYLK